MSETRPMTALEREVLGWMAERSRTAFLAARIAEQVDKPLPKVQAALTGLRARREVAYFDGHPGSWAVTALGRALVFLDEPYEPNSGVKLRARPRVREHIEGGVALMLKVALR